MVRVMSFTYSEGELLFVIFYRSPKSEKPTTPDHKPDFGGLISGIQQRNAANQPSKNVANAAESTKQTPSKTGRTNVHNVRVFQLRYAT